MALLVIKLDSQEHDLCNTDLEHPSPTNNIWTPRSFTCTSSPASTFTLCTVNLRPFSEQWKSSATTRSSPWQDSTKYYWKGWRFQVHQALRVCGLTGTTSLLGEIQRFERCVTSNACISLSWLMQRESLRGKSSQVKSHDCPCPLMATRLTCIDAPRRGADYGSKEVRVWRLLESEHGRHERTPQ